MSYNPGLTTIEADAFNGLTVYNLHLYIEVNREYGTYRFLKNSFTGELKIGVLSDLDNTLNELLDKDKL